MSAETKTLRRDLKLWEALAMSVGIMAPTLAMALNGTAPAGLIGSKVPLAFLLAFAGIALVAYGFVRLTSYFSHAGSVYALAGTTLGPQAGFVGGWALFGYYFVSTIATFAATGLFAVQALHAIGFEGHIPWLPIGLATAAGVLVLGTRDVRVAARSLLTLEGASVTLIVILVVVIIVRLISGSPPGDQHLTLQPFVPDGGISFGAVMAASVFGFLSWAGFEGTASLGEETGDARRNIPRALMFAVGATGVLYIVTMWAETVGFGANSAGAEAFASSGAPLDVLAREYVGSAMGTALAIGATASAFASALGSAVGASRIGFAFCRDGWGPTALAKPSPRTGGPTRALAAVVGLATVGMVITFLAWTKEAVNVYFYVATIGVLALLIVYAIASAGALRFLFFKGPPKAPRREMIIPVLAVAYLAYILYKQFAPAPESPYNILPFVAIGWTVFGALMALLRPAQSRRMGAVLSAEMGTLEADSDPEDRADRPAPTAREVGL
jgi:amino acid transporter